VEIRPILFKDLIKCGLLDVLTCLVFAWQCIDENCEGCTDGYLKKHYAIKEWNKRVK
jgi:hypothetical protein